MKEAGGVMVGMPTKAVKERVTVFMEKGCKDELIREAEKRGQSLSWYIRHLIKLGRRLA